MGICPFHQEVTPSLYVRESDQSWVCFSCGLNGNEELFCELIESRDE